jgi:hypothetical protein
MRGGTWSEGGKMRCTYDDMHCSFHAVCAGRIVVFGQPCAEEAADKPCYRLRNERTARICHKQGTVTPGGVVPRYVFQWMSVIITPHE